MNADVPFFTDTYLRQANEILQLPREIMDPLKKTLLLMRGSEILMEAALKCHDRIFGVSGPEEISDAVWPDRKLLTSELGELAGMFAAVVLISGLEKAAERFRAKRIPEHIFVDTMSDMEVWIRHYYKVHGVWGFDNLGWLKYHLTARLFRLGRLQFVLDPFPNQVHVFRHIHTGETVALSGAGILYNREGLTDGNNGELDTEGSWESRFEMTDQDIAGHLISRAGYANRNSVKLNRAEWRQVLTENDLVLHVHIPEGSKMAHELCVDSYLQALDFYAMYFPETEFKAFACGSWLLSPQFPQLLPHSSNIVRFLNDYHLFPLQSGDESTLDRVFGATKIDPATAPRDTTLRRAILDFMAEGHRMIAGGGFLLREDVPKLT